MVDDDRTLAVALSGGGHRATAFGIGALLAIADADLNRRVTSISSVSGGSIANGVAMVGPDYGASSAAAIGAHFSLALRAVAKRGVLLRGAPATRTYVRLIIAAGAFTGLAFIAVLAMAVAHWWLALLIGAVVLLGSALATWKLLRQRSVRTEAAIDAELLGAACTTLGDVYGRELSVHHVICTTELQTGTSFFFTNRGVWGYGFGGTSDAPPVRLATAVQASASVPGAFAPRSIGLAELGLGGAGRILLSDGGVYDNMADEWEYGYGNRRRLFADLPELQPNQCDVLVVVNGSGGWKERKDVAEGGLSEELAGLLRSQAVQYDVSTAHRRRALHTVFRESDGSGSGLDGLFVQITDSPYRVTQKFGSKPGREPDDLSKRADEARAYLDDHDVYSPETWTRWAKENCDVPTTLARLGSDVTARLVEHGYVLTKVNLYVLDGLGALDQPINRARLQELCA